MFGLVLLIAYFWLVRKFYRWHKNLSQPKATLKSTLPESEMVRVLGKKDHKELKHLAKMLEPFYHEGVKK